MHLATEETVVLELGANSQTESTKTSANDLRQTFVTEQLLSQNGFVPTGPTHRAKAYLALSRVRGGSRLERPRRSSGHAAGTRVRTH